MHVRRWLCLGVVVLLSGCPEPIAPPQFAVTVETTGYDPTLGRLAVELRTFAPQGNFTEQLEIGSTGTGAFTNSLAEGTSFSIRITEQPTEQRCAPTMNGVSTAYAPVIVVVTCTTNTYSVGGIARGVDRGGLALRETASSQNLTLAVDAGPFAFPTPVTYGSNYAVMVQTSPTGRDCTASFGSGVVTGLVDGVRVDCSPRRLPLIVTLDGIDIDGVRIDETITSQQLTLDAGAITARFPQPLLWETNFNVTVTPPPNSGRICTVDAGRDTVLDPLLIPLIHCEKERFTVGGVITHVDGGTVSLAELTTGQMLDAGSGPFTFANTIEWDTTIDVELTDQPAGSFCRVDGGTRLVRTPITDIDVRCATGFPVSGLVRNLRGMGLVISQASTGQQVTVTQTGNEVPFSFPSVVPNGEPLGVSITTHPAGQTCRLEPSGVTTVTAPVALTIVCGPRTTELVINEVGSVANAQSPLWIELYNGTTQTLALSDYTLRTGARIAADGGAAPITNFSLPDASVPPATAFVISGKPIADLHDYPTMRFVVQSTFTPAPGGALQLERGTTIVDALAFEDAGVASANWQGAGLVLPEGATDFGRSLARAQTADTNTSADFSTCDFPTPGGINDVCTSADADQDGLPDVAEVPGTTWNELPLYDWGARLMTRDVFIEVDWVQPDGFNGTFDPAILPRREALERVRQVFANRSIALHFDTGALYHPAPGVSPMDFDLGGGNQTAWACTVSFAGNVTSFYKLKADNTDLRRWLSFHHALFANALADVTCANAGAGTSGSAELGGNDFAITIGRTNLSTATTNGLNQVINWQSATLMHEFGHNLGLRHGGFEDYGYKPNYLSVMNYMYQFDGLPVIGQNEGDRYYRQFVLLNVCTGAPGITTPAALNRNRFTTPAMWGLDFSDGTSLELNEASLNESAGFGRMGSGSIDWDWDTTIDTMNVSADINALGITPRVCPRTATGMDLVRDNNDWNALVLTFSRTQRGSASKSPTPRTLRFDPYGDRQPLLEEQPTPRD